MLPQLTYLALTFLGLGLIIANHGKPRPPINAWSSVIATVIVMVILWWGNFFAPITSAL